MSLQLQILKGHDVGKSIALIDGERIRVGRSPSVDFSCPSEKTLTGIHFTITTDSNRVQLTVAEGVQPIVVNGTATAHCELKAGDAIQCGDITFGILPIATETAEQSEPSISEPISTSVDVIASIAPIDEPTTDLKEVIASIELSQEAYQLIDLNESIEFNIAQLRSHSLERDATELHIRSLSKQAAVAWGIECLENAVRKTSVAHDERSLRAAKSWVADPNETNRREAEAAAAAANYADPAAFLAQAVFWSGGSIAPASSPADTPTQDHLTGVAVSAALKMLGV